MSKSIPADIIDEAIAWVIRLDMSESPTKTGIEFEHWLARKPQHRQAWERVNQMRKGFSSLPNRAIGDTLQRVEAGRQSSRLSRRRALKSFAGLGVVIGSGLLAYRHTPWQRLIADQVTATGEYKPFRLEDGSRLTLNTDSAASSSFTDRLRRIQLHRGEMALTTGADQHFDPVRPLIADTPLGRLETASANFIMRLAENRLRITLQGGRARVFNATGDSRVITGKEDLWLSDAGITPARSAIPPDAWLRGAVAGQEIPLGELLDELARYRVGVIDYSPDLAELPVSGVFQLRQSDETLEFLARVHPISVDFRTSYWVVVRPA
ncbi:MAG: DUF4880 domain-containing protein [Pseudomonadota bacterium]